jgi:adenosylmethionine-8-amino-7-oxononanoate aminotransferase
VIELSFMLRDFFAPDGLSRAFYTSGGSDSVEGAHCGWRVSTTRCAARPAA